MSPIRMSKIESGVRAVLEFNEAFNRHDVAGMMKCLSDDCVLEDANNNSYSGKESIIRFYQDLFSESPQANIEIEEIFGLGLRVVMRWKYDNARGVDVFKLKDGLICEKLSYVKG